jgi:hypothetical protein
MSMSLSCMGFWVLKRAQNSCPLRSWIGSFTNEAKVSPSSWPVKKKEQYPLWISRFTTTVMNKYPQFIMDVLAQAKNGDKQFLNIEISCSQWERLSMHSNCLDLFSFKFWGEGADFFPFFLCSQHVPFKFPIFSLGSQCVPQGCSQ